MTTATRSKIHYEVRCGSWIVGSGSDREEAEVILARHAERTNTPVDQYLITPVLRKEKE